MDLVIESVLTKDRQRSGRRNADREWMYLLMLLQQSTQKVTESTVRVRFETFSRVDKWKNARRRWWRELLIGMRWDEKENQSHSFWFQFNLHLLAAEFASIRVSPSHWPAQSFASKLFNESLPGQAQVCQIRRCVSFQA